MSNSTISRDHKIEILGKKFYSVGGSSVGGSSVGGSISFCRKNASIGRISSREVRSSNKNVLEDKKLKLINSINKYSSENIYSLSTGSGKLNSVLYTLSYANFFASLIIPISSIELKESNHISKDADQAISRSKIQEYFDHKPSIRAQRRQEYVTYIQAAQDVFDTLKLGNTENILDGYDGAVDILAECDQNVIIEAVEIAKEKHISDNNSEIAESWEQNWEILIKALSCALKIKSHQKMSLLLSLCDRRNKLSRLIKLTLIDAIVDLDLDPDLVRVMLQIFMSERESDDFIRNYAQEQAAEC